MGIDIYARWKDQTEAEVSAQYTGFSDRAGNVGYLREAYHGGPYATDFFLKEATKPPEYEAKIPSSVLYERLPATLELVKLRYKKIYDEDLKDGDPPLMAYVDFCELVARKEQETGELVTIIFSG